MCIEGPCGPLVNMWPSKAGLVGDVAIKRVLKEIPIWSELKHDNILPLLGITTDFDFTMSIVSPWMQLGNALDYVQNEAVDPRPLRYPPFKPKA
ncbi:hypothetical protein SCLCIDRAFT_946908 [Scleroderma citrinum Foug A]|uniref:Protein kinase domain-containing protein n=1 Tax=Scleroderma citrinum Foug A TaxID=1036808 RepID=A0A0C3DWT6_9AGAM|nr:hypothetical protein SCLCIDRAFT_946908 [Scleroderma citrinum Foug A]